MKRRNLIILALGFALTLIPLVELQAQQRRNRGNNGYGSQGFSQNNNGQNNNGQGNDYGRSRNGYGNQSRYSAGQSSAIPGAPVATPTVATTVGGATSRPGAPVAIMPTAELIQPGRPLPGDLQILSEKSIFDKIRRTRNANSYSGFRPPEPQSTYVKPPGVPILVGTLLGDSDYMAYLEDPDTSKVWPFAAGDVLPGDYGHVVKVSLDYIEVAKDGEQPRKILVAEQLRGNDAPPPALTNAPSTNPSSGTGAAAASDLSNSGDLTIEQKMKLRRQQQLGQ